MYEMACVKQYTQQNFSYKVILDLPVVQAN